MPLLYTHTRIIMASLFVNQLTTLDFSYLCPKRGLVGETWIVDAVLTGDLNEQGMVFDFGHVKKQVKASLDYLADHRLLVPVAHPDIEFTSSEERLEVKMLSPETGVIECKTPAQAMLLVNAEAITPDAMTPILEKALMTELPGNVSGVSLRLYPEAIDSAFYHYSHGLKKHLGDCQRIAHGHRSKITIQVDGKPAPELEASWSKRWQDIYIATQEDLIENIDKDNRSYHRFGYTSDQGYFELTIASDHCYLIETDSTVELLAEHIAEQLFAQESGKQIRVTAYEGFNKGAISERKV